MKLLPLLSTLLLSPLAIAQEAVPEPAPQLSKFDPALGTWTGSGTFRMGDADMPWTATVTTKRVLDGFFVQEDMRIDVGMPTAIIYHTVYGWDDQEGRFVHFVMNNLGETHEGNSYWADGQTMVNSQTMISEGQLVTDRSVSKFDADSFTIRIDRAYGGGDFAVHIEGNFKRGGTEFSAATAKDVMAPPHEAMSAFQPMVGNWHLEAKMLPGPGMPMMDVTAREKMGFILGGQVFLTQVHGDPIPDMPGPPYEGVHYQAWDPSRKRVASIWISNMGEMVRGQTHAGEDGTLISLSVGIVPMYGMPAADRGLTIPDGDGFHYEGWSMVGSLPPAKNFEGTMSRADL